MPFTVPSSQLTHPQDQASMHRKYETWVTVADDRAPAHVDCVFDTLPAANMTKRRGKSTRPFGLSASPSRLVAIRWYFICPSSNRRCKVLYQPPGACRFRSRRGFRYKLQYQSQRSAPYHRYQRAATKLAKRVLRKGPPEWQEQYEDYEFPPKPPWMRWKTYNRLDEKAQAYEKAADDELAWQVQRLLLPGEDIDGMIDRILK
jgi:hypothetical protein